MNEPTLSRLQHLMTVREEAEALGSGSLGRWTPAADWLDAGSCLTLLLDVPAAVSESLEVHEDGQTLTVAGVRAAAPADAGRRLSTERFSGQFSRTLEFPEAVVPGSGEATLHGGVLQIRFRKLHPTIDVHCSPVPEEEQ